MSNLIGIGALIDQSWEQYRTHYKQLFKISAWVLLVAAINIVAILMYPLDASSIDGTTVWEKIGIVLFLLNNTVVALVVGTWMINALIGLIHDQHSSGKRSMKALSQASWKLVWPHIVLRLELFLVYAGSLLLPLLLIWFFSNVASSFLPSALVFLLLFASLLLFLPPLALFIYLSFAVFGLVVDGHKGWSAIRTSISLVRERFWPVALRLLIPKLLYFGLFFLAQFLAVIILQVLTAGLIQGADLVWAGRLEWISLMLTYSVLFVFLNPMLFVTDHLIYQQLKTTK